MTAADTARPSFLLRQQRRLTGFLLFGLGGALLLSVISHNPVDPSWNAAAPGPASNLLGAPGAYMSDIVMQMLGWTGSALGGGAALFGALLATRADAPAAPKRRMLWRFGALLMAVAALAAASAALPKPDNWGLATGLGGLIGDLIHHPLSAQLARFDAPAPRAWVNAAALILAFVGLILAFGLRWRHAGDAADAANSGLSGLRTVLANLRDWSEEQFDWGDEAGEPVAAKPAAEREVVVRPGAPLTPTSKAKPTPKPVKRKKAEKKAREPKIAAKTAQAPLPFEAEPLSDFELPSLKLLAEPRVRANTVDAEVLKRSGRLLNDILSDFGVKGEVREIRPGPVVTLYEFEPAPGVKSSRVINLADDVARSMSAASARIAVVPGRNALGVELPNRRRETVYLRSLFESQDFAETRSELPLALGETIDGEPYVADLARMPHLLIAGTTGSGKSVGVNSMILSLLFRLPPDRCKFIMIDPKMLELSIYDGIPHLLSPVVTDPKKAVTALKWTVKEMEARYRKMSKLGVRNIAGFNARVADAAASGETLERRVQTGYDPETGKPIYETEILPLEPMPFIVVVIDEMADLMMVAGKDIEGAVQRLAQMARAAGIHLITATQRPSVDVITGTIKANFPTRISFQVTSKIDSRTILGEQGGEQLLGQGDMLYRAAGGRIRRLHGAFVSDDEVEAAADWLREQGAPDYLDDVTRDEEEDAALEAAMSGAELSLYDQAVAIVTGDRKASTSYLQRRLQIGYNRAANLIEQMEAEGVISPPNHAGKREILVDGPPEI